MEPLQDPLQLAEGLRAGHRPRKDWAVGLEYEQFVTEADGRPRAYSGPGGVQEILRRLQEWSGWAPIEEGGALLGLRARDGRTVTLEPGAQLEFGSRPCRNLTELSREVEGYFEWLQRAVWEFDVRFVALGAHPAAAPEEIERIPKARYAILEPWLREAGELGVWMMKATAGIQVNLDHEDEADAMAKLGLAHALAPVFSALGANSPVRAGSWSGFVGWRGHVWMHTDPSRCGIVEAFLRQDAGFEDYVAWALDVPMLFIQRQGRLLDLRGRSFRQFLEQGFEDQRATLEDWDLHLSTLFPEARFRPQLELRSLDSQCPQTALAWCAFLRGLFYDPEALQAARDLCRSWTREDLVAGLEEANRHGLAGLGPGGVPFLELARELLGLVRLPEEEEAWLTPLRISVEEEQASPGELLARRFREEWQQDVARLVQETRCTQPGV